MFRVSRTCVSGSGSGVPIYVSASGAGVSICVSNSCASVTIRVSGFGAAVSISILALVCVSVFLSLLRV